MGGDAFSCPRSYNAIGLVALLFLPSIGHPLGHAPGILMDPGQLFLTIFADFDYTTTHVCRFPTMLLFLQRPLYSKWQSTKYQPK